MNLFETLNAQFAIPVIRQNDGKTLTHIAEALIDGGMTTLEITLMSDEAFQVISSLSKKAEF